MQDNTKELEPLKTTDKTPLTKKQVKTQAKCRRRGYHYWNPQVRKVMGKSVTVAHICITCGKGKFD